MAKKKQNRLQARPPFLLHAPFYQGRHWIGGWLPMGPRNGPAFKEGTGGPDDERGKKSRDKGGSSDSPKELQPQLLPFSRSFTGHREHSHTLNDVWAPENPKRHGRAGVPSFSCAERRGGVPWGVASLTHSHTVQGLPFLVWGSDI